VGKLEKKGKIMDYRKRKYYLVKLDYIQHNYRIEQLKDCIPSIKFSPPYNHFVHKQGYDGKIMTDMCKPGGWQIMISCDEEYAEALLYNLAKAKRRDYFGCEWFELTKELCGQ
jgi:hypothetical protein